MARNFPRSCSLTLSGSRTKTVTGGGPAGLRITFSIKQWHVQSPNMATFRVYNPSPDTRSKLKGKEFDKVTFSAGYEGNVGLIFSGNLKQSIFGHETAVDTYVDLFCADGDQAYNAARVTKTLAAGWTPADKLKAAADAMAPYGVTMGVNTLNLSQPKFPRGIPLVGMARDIIRQVALSNGGLWSMQLGKLTVTPKSLDTGQSGAVELTAATGLVGWPRQTQDGILIRSLLNPALQPLQKIKLDPSQIIEAERDNNPFSESGPVTNNNLDVQGLGAGVYTIFHMDRTGDTRGNDWYDESMCIGVVTATGSPGSLPPSQFTLGYSLGQS